ncbi:MAG: transketolase C-terminal domain-containing protein, partial [Lawsonibacter sp.]
CFDLTVYAFNMAEKYRTPAYLMTDEAIGHLRETVTIRELDASEIVDRKQPQGVEAKDFRPYDYDSGMPSAMPPFGSNQYLSRTTGSTHDEKGEFCPTPKNIDRVTHYLTDKIEKHADDICLTKKFYLDDAEVVFITYGCSTRSAMSAMEQLREEGVNAGLLQLQTVWPLPEKEIRQVLSSAKTVVVPELNLGQIAGEIRKFNDYGCNVIQANRVDGILIFPTQIIDVWKEAR